ncbi:hypothetical protein OG864_52170 [Streptomyces sp. NBC_00124]|uniref:hypothetical protein n=1 Tax=Streptomyces sp. NBC_00124 TaxID=2975662 RepID=UPI002251D62C|nr:hypothetical protein [Streptomyces sp. NBC_00124]MCX5367230.1 hypothetical protein [Streptomyces sp. NBC_00124]
MYRFTRHTGRALTAVALITGTATACSDSPTPSKAPQSQKTASSTASPTAQPSSPSGREQLNKEARDLLNMTDRLESDEEGLVSSGTLAVPGQNLDKTIKTGTALRVEVACAGEGTVTFTVASGTAKTAKRVDCTQPTTNEFDFTTAGPGLTIQADSPEEERVGTAYMVSHIS